MSFPRLLDLHRFKSSAFVFGPRMTGKTFLLRQLQASSYFDLLDPETELTLKASPSLFWERIRAVPRESLVVVDEIQRIPALLDYAQKGIEEVGIRIIMSGSSARKLRRGAANLLGGRALDLRLHPLTAAELGERFHLERALRFGTLPRITQMLLEGAEDESRRLLRSYYTTYIKEEVQAEALTRNVGAFQRFLNVAAQGNAQIIEFANISRECSVPMSTVKEYYSILEDTLLGEFLWPWDRSERRKARPKFYFFDCGVIRAIQNRLTDPPTPDERGFLFETWFIRELTRHRDYLAKPHDFGFWREGPHEIDLLVLRAGTPILAFECKAGRDPLPAPTLAAFRKRFPAVPLMIVSLQDAGVRKLDSGIELLPWKPAVDRYLALT